VEVTAGAQRRRRPIRAGLAALALLTIGLAALAAVSLRPHVVKPLTFTAGSSGTARTVFAEALASGVGGRVVETTGIPDALEQVETGSIDVALVPGTFRFGDLPHVRQVATLHFAALHLLVKAELASDFADSLTALRGKTIDLGVQGRPEFGIAAALLDFVGIRPESRSSPEGFVPRALAPSDLLASLAGQKRDALPDVIFLLETLPSPIVQTLVEKHSYRLVPIPFADAFAMSALTHEWRTIASSHPSIQGLQREFVYDTIIPADTYGIDPPVPPIPLHTLGARILLVARDDVDADTIEQLIDVVYHTRLAQTTHPALDVSLLRLPPELPLHRGTIAYLKRDQPLITGAATSALSAVLSGSGAFFGASLFLWQWYRQRVRRQREQTFESYIRKVAAIERQVGELERGDSLKVEPLLELQRELARLKNEALERFSSGELEGRELISGFLTHVNDARDFVGQLIVYVRNSSGQSAAARSDLAEVVRSQAIADAEEPPRDASGAARDTNRG